MILVVFNKYAYLMNQFYFSYLGSYLISIGVLIYYLHQKDNKLFSFRKLSIHHIVLYVVLFLAFGYLTDLVSKMVLESQNTDGVNNVISKYINTPKIYIILIALAILGPVFEELLCRGLLMTSYFKESRFYMDIVLSASVFSVLHLIGFSWGWVEFLYYFLMGALFAILFRMGNSIYYSIIAHIVWNIISIYPILAYLLAF
ncbi:TPA: CPBP family intramembrane metalloprotease [Streptococcus equi subsp. zooepidemicus]|nr:CPBP family intramembrane metalloprotease [Streptococcus equi subsp. zooepidemicus]HEL0004789.1 CPBP family intramembrane metalloprotease [Streptococcus equi subsp. zooepidemicus]HEL1033978.1 CPBP family intramembrane metalloprotease [Streptococcus equi subsp. zooepidemicus]HEL1082434.1 CPBP family intramembrane metalloprotease [Streptococcus equi subsp. zooepidemicus]HEL1164292.1 CPBP family intramembrane metalloprotease [Streptococcus equi subsp. zooepidemicus]